MSKEVYTHHAFLTIEYDSEAVAKGNLVDALSIPADRLHDLIHMAEKDGLSRGEGSPGKPYDAFTGLLDILPTLSGNEIFFLLLTGFTMDLKMQMMKRDPFEEMLKEFLE